MLKSVSKLRLLVDETRDAYLRGDVNYTIELDGIAERIEQEVSERFMEVPTDADGVPWHLGDVTENGNTVRGLRFDQHGWHFFGTVNDIDPSIHRHYHAPTVEDVLREFALAVCKDDALTIRKGVVDEYAAKLQLREDA